MSGTTGCSLQTPQGSSAGLGMAKLSLKKHLVPKGALGLSLKPAQREPMVAHAVGCGRLGLAQSSVLLPRLQEPGAGPGRPQPKSPGHV